MPTPSAFAPVLPLARLCRAAGGRALLVGGAVRDMLLEQYGLTPPLAGGDGQPIDLDVEVHGIEAAELEGILAQLGPVNLVGRAFSVWQTQLGGMDVDVSLPRRDSRVRPGHRGILAVGDPHLGLVESARRRDLTVNAIAYDPLSGQLEDPFGGLSDLQRRLLRAVDPDTFGEDPLRALRVPQLAARFRFDVDPALVALCAAVPVHELPAERVSGELRKLLMLPVEPAWGLRVGVRARLWRRVHPALALDRWEPVYRAVDRAAQLRDGRLAHRGHRREALMFGALLHPVPAPALPGLLDRLDLHSQGGFPLRAAVLGALERAPKLEPPREDGALRLLAREAQAAGGLCLWLALAEALGRDCEAIAARAEELGIGMAAPAPLVRGRDLKALGLPPGPAMGALLEQLYQRQLVEGIEEQQRLLEGLAP
jgi:tRNA nucleotidyltransferase (CCA-adding enzyme)